MKQVEIPLVFNLGSVNLSTKTGVLKIRKSHLSKGKSFDVTLSNGLIGSIKANMKDPRKMKFTDTDFESLNGSTSFNENPLKLVRFMHPGKPDTFHVQFVDDKGFSFTEYFNAMGQRADKIKFEKWSPKQYLRYYEVECSK